MLIKPTWHGPLVNPNGTLTKPLVDLLRSLAEHTDNAATSDTLTVLADRVTVLEGAGTSWSGYGQNGISVSKESGSYTFTLTATTSNVPEGTNLYFTDARAKLACVADAIVDAVTDVAPSQNAVYDALAALAASIAAIPTGVPTLIASGDTYTVPANYQALFAYPITVDGLLVVDGVLIEVT